MDSAAKYEFLQRVGGVKIVVFRGRDTQSGQSVLLHQLTDPGDHAEIFIPALRYLVGHPVSSGGRLLDLVEIQGSQFLVTVDQPECLAVREWLEWELQHPSPGPVVTALPSPSAHQPGEFTRLFQVPTGGNPATEQPSAPPLPVAPTAPTPLAAENQPGEFTRLFRSPLAPTPESSRQALPIGSPSQQAPGEFTRIFGSGAPPAGGSTSAPPNPISAPGSLTESLDPRRSPVSAPSVSSGPGEFTRVIGLPSSNPPPATAAPPAPPPPQPAFTPISMPMAPPLPMPAPLPSVAPPAMQAPMLSPSPAPSNGGSQQSRAVIILFAVLLLAALGLILFVILRR